jgi:hypothetical protein
LLNCKALNYNEILFKEPELLLKEHFEKAHTLIGKPLPKPGHCILLEDYHYSIVEVADPKDCERHTEDIEELYRQMWDEEFGCFFLIHK